MINEYGEWIGMADYRLPSGQVVRCDDTACKGAVVIDFTLADGKIVKAIRENWISDVGVAMSRLFGGDDE